MPPTTLPVALHRAQPLLTEAPDPSRLRDGYLDLLDDEPAVQGPANHEVWSSATLSTVYDHAQALMRTVASGTRLPDSARRLPNGSRVLDVGCGPGNLTGELGRACSPDGIALGVDISAPMLQRAASAETTANTAFLRADARALPFHDDCFDVLTSIAAVHNVPEPYRALRECARVLAPGGRMTAMVLAAGSLFDRYLPVVLGKRFNPIGLEPGRAAEVLHSAGMTTVHTRHSGPLLWIDAVNSGGPASATP